MRKAKTFEGSKDRQSTSVTDNFSYFMDWAVSETMKNDATINALETLELLGSAKRVSGPTFESANMAFDSPGGIQTAYKDGQPVHYYLPDPALVIGFATQLPQLNSVTKALASVTRTLRAGVTSLPPFAIKQVFDDIQRAYAFAGVKNNAALVKSVMINFPKNWLNEIRGKKSDGVREMERLGIVGSFDVMPQRGLDATLVKAGAKSEGFWHSAIRMMEAGAKASDVSLRQAIYSQVLKETGSQVMAESSAREIINFSRRGANGAMQWATSVIPFFNAYAQGMDKLANAALGSAVGGKAGLSRNMFYKRMGVLTTMGLIYALMMSDDEDYMAASDQERDNNWFLPFTGGMGKIPAPPELALFYKAIPERVVRYYKFHGTPEEEAAVDILREMAIRGFDVFSSPNVTPVAIKPFLENLANYSFFLGRPLESTGQLRLEPFERYGANTTESAKALARVIDDFANRTGIEMVKISPIKIENAMRGLLGTVGGLSLSISDAILHPDKTDRPFHQQLGPQLTGLSAVTRDPIGSNHLNKAYAFESKVEEAFNTYNRILKTRPEDAAEFMRSRAGLLSIREPYRSLMDDIRTLNKQAMAINNAKDMDPEERRKAIDELRVIQNDIARQYATLRRIARDTQRNIDAQ
jgi:hypothetical protein